MPQVAYRFIQDKRGFLEVYHLNTADTLRILGVKPSTYNGLVKRLEELADKDSKRAQKLAAKRREDDDNKKMILEIVKARSGFVPGHRTMQMELLIRYGRHLSVKKIRFYKQSMGLMTTVDKNPYNGQDTYLHPLLSPGNKVARCFYLGYRKVILVDITYLKYDLGKKVCYHIEFYDPFMDQVLGKATSDSMSVGFVKEAWNAMMRDHKGEFVSYKVYLHSDNGSQLLETSFSELVSSCEFLRSVSRPGTPGDNRPIEAKFSRIKGVLEQKLLLCKTMEQVSEMIDGYIKDHEENDHCLSLGGLTPNQFEKYVLTGVYPLDSYYGIESDQLHPISSLINRMKEIARKRTERAKEERQVHAERMKAIAELQKVDPGAVIARDSLTALQEKAKCLKAKQAYDTDIKFWEIMEDKLTRAVSFIRKAPAEVLEELKNRENWMKYPELQYIKDFPKHRDGKMMLFEPDEMDPDFAGPASLWLMVDEFLSELIEFFDKATPKTRKLLENRENWGLFPELSFLKGWKPKKDEAAS